VVELLQLNLEVADFAHKVDALLESAHRMSVRLEWADWRSAGRDVTLREAAFRVSSGGGLIVSVSGVELPVFEDVGVAFDGVLDLVLEAVEEEAGLVDAFATLLE
jgi:hypothetical protein